MSALQWVAILGGAAALAFNLTILLRFIMRLFNRPPASGRGQDE